MLHIPLPRLLERAEDRGAKLPREELEHLRACAECLDCFGHLLHEFCQFGQPAHSDLKPETDNKAGT
jgi:hypothetical protein